MNGGNRIVIALFVAALAVVVVGIARAAEVHSNGTGGGPWSDPATWRDAAVPGPEDSVVIAADDSVTFDARAVADGVGPAPAAGDAAASVAAPGSVAPAPAPAPAPVLAAPPAPMPNACKDLYVDPGGLLTFKPGGRRVLALDGPLESYGLLKLDAGERAEDFIEIRLTGTDPAQRALKLGKGGALLATGRPKMKDGRRNVLLRSVPAPPLPPPAPAPGAPAPPPVPPLTPVQRLATVEAVAGTSVDLRDIQVDAVAIKASTIDNTGAKPNERLNVTGCLFTSAASIALEYCDTASIVNNSFEYAAEPLPFNAISVMYSPLAEIRGNSVIGKYTYGISGYQQTDTMVSGNVLIGCTSGVYWVGSNDMIKNLIVRDATVGVVVTSMTGALEDVTFDNCVTGLSVTPATVQATNLRFVNVPKHGVRIHHVDGALTLVNCDVTPEQIKVEPTTAATPARRVQAMQYCVVGVKGAVPAGAAVTVATANPPQPLPKGAVDLNIRNAPAAVEPGGMTPLPKTLKPLIVKSWVIEGDGRLTPAPQYNVSVTARAEGPADAEPKVVKTVTVTPEASWYRAKPNEPKATVEVMIP